MRNYWKWLIGGGLAFWAYKVYAQTPERLGDLKLTIVFKPNTLSMPGMNNALNAMAGMRQVCTGAPMLGSAVQAPGVFNGTTVVTVISATWTHDTMGPIRESVRQCYLNHLQAMDSNVVDVRAERIS